MSASPEKNDRKHGRMPSKEGQAIPPESSLTWCVAHLHKPGSSPENRVDCSGLKEIDKRCRASQWRALVAIRTQHIKGGKAGIARFRGQGGLRPLLNLLKHPECSRKTLDLALSILANCCTESETCTEVRKLDGINVVVDIMKKNVAMETVQNRAARALGNLAMDPENSALIHSAGGVPALLLCVSLSPASPSPTDDPPTNPSPKLECAQSAVRALLYLSDTPSNRLSLLTQGTLSAIAPLIAPEYPQSLRMAALKTIHELTRGCGVECAREVSRSGVLAQLGVMASGDAGTSFEDLALKTLSNMCSQGCLRPLVGSLGVIQKFVEEVKKDPLKSGVFFKALCLCCKEAVNRAKVKESGGLEVLASFLSNHQSHPLSKLAILACVDFVFDESAMEQLQELGLVPLLVSQLVKLTREEEQMAEKMDVSFSTFIPSSELFTSSDLDSFDFPPPEGYKKEETCREQGLCSPSFLSLRSWLVSEGLISSEGDLLDASSIDGEWGGLQVPSASSSQTSSPNSHSSSCPKNSVLSPSAVFLTPKKTNQHPCGSPSSSPCSLTAQTLSSSPNNNTQIPLSPLKSQKRRRASSVSLTKVTLDMPPCIPRSSAYHHPYHPEPWTPESPILLLLSRFSHASDPSAALVNSNIMSGLLYYLTQHQDPSNRCFRMLCRLSCNPNCLQALVRTGSVALIQHHLCQRGGEKRSDRVRGKVKQLGTTLLGNLRVQCESGFGSGVLTHVMLSGSESDKMNCALSLPFLTSNKSLLRKLLLDSGGLLLALQRLSCETDEMNEAPHKDSERVLTDLVNLPQSGLTSQLQFLYFPLLAGCLSALAGTIETNFNLRKKFSFTTSVVSKDDKDSSPPLKKPRLGDTCPYGISDFDLVLLMDDGTRIPAKREAVAGQESTESVYSDYFRGLLRGGFGEAQSYTEEDIPIKDVSTGMLLPVLHYLHGCRFSKEKEGGSGEQCQVLDTVIFSVLDVSQNKSEELSADEFVFQKSSLGEMMIGACRFLVGDLQKKLEDLCVSRLLSCLTKPSSEGVSSPTRDNAEKNVQIMVQDIAKFTEEKMVCQTSELELTGLTKKLNSSLQEMETKITSVVETIQKMNTGLSAALDKNTIKKVTSISQPVCASTGKTHNPEELSPGPKDSVKPAAQGSKTVVADKALAALLPQLYWFSQRYSYPALGRACLTLLLGCRDLPQPHISSSVAGDCLERLAREADSAETLKQDLLSLVSAALS